MRNRHRNNTNTSSIDHSNSPDSNNRAFPSQDQDSSHASTHNSNTETQKDVLANINHNDINADMFTVETGDPQHEGGYVFPNSNIRNPDAPSPSLEFESIFKDILHGYSYDN